MAKGAGKRKWYKSPLFVAGIAICILLLLALAGACLLLNRLSMIDNPNIARSPYYEYIIKVRGIENFDTPSGDARIYFPLPLYGNAPVLPFSGRLQNGTGKYGQGDSPYDCTIVDINPFGYYGTRWLEAVNTSHGWMLEAGIEDTDYREVDFNRVPKPITSFDKMEIRIQYPVGPIGSKATNETVEGLKVRPLYPDAGQLPTNYTLWMPGENVTGYTSYLYLDEGFRPLTADSTLDIYASVVIRVDDHPYGMNRDNENYLFMINESIPGNITGFVPVKVQYVGKLSSIELSTYLNNFYRK